MVESNLIDKNIHFLMLLSDESKSSKAQQRSLLTSITRSQTLSLQEICFNLLHGNFELTSDEKSHLKRYRNAIRRIASKSIKYSDRKQLLRLPLVKALLKPLSIKLAEHFCSNIDTVKDDDNDQGYSDKDPHDNDNADDVKED